MRGTPTASWSTVRCAERTLPVLEDRRQNDDRPSATIESLRARERDEILMNDCRTAAIEAHAAAREAGVPDAVEPARAARQAAAVAHMFDRSGHGPHVLQKLSDLAGQGTPIAKPNAMTL